MENGTRVEFSHDARHVITANFDKLGGKIDSLNQTIVKAAENLSKLTSQTAATSMELVLRDELGGRVQAIQNFCASCSKWKNLSKEGFVSPADCTVPTCPLHKYRPGA